VITLPALSNDRIILSPIQEQDYRALYSIVGSGEYLVRWRYRGSTPSPEEFRKDLWQDVLAQFVVTNKSDRAVIGLVTAYHANHRNQVAYVAGFSVPRYRNSGALLMGFELFFDFLFLNWNFRKLYTEAIEFNLAQFNSLQLNIFEEEGRLRDFEYYDGRYWDLVVSAITRESWASSRRAFHDHNRALGVTMKGYHSGLRPDEFCQLLFEDIGKGRLARIPELGDRIVEDLGLDSLEILELVDALEQIQSSVVEETELATLATVRDWYRVYLEALQMPEPR
jgi:RimJ/RimL family protein N-acetyltransferase/acyl carrier protein